MKQTVYVDVLVSVNLIVDYFLLYAAAVICGRKKNRLRLCAAAAAGGAGSLILLLPPMPYIADLLASLALALIMTAAAFGFSGMRTFLRTAFVLFALSACYSGAALVLWLFMPMKKITVNNGAVYIGIEPMTLIIATAVLYLLLSLLSGKLARHNAKRTHCTLTIASEGGEVSVGAVIDTGNMLTEPFSGLPVILAPQRRISSVLPDGIEGFLRGGAAVSGKHIRAVPFSSAGGSGLLPAFIPERITVETGGSIHTGIRAYIAAAPDESIGGEALINPDAVDL